MLKADNNLNKKKSEKILKDFYGANAKLKSMQKLTGGKTAATYRLVSNIDPKGILIRVAHVYQKNFLSFEKTMMENEKKTIAILRDNDIPIPQLLKYCPYKSVINKEYNIYEFVESDIPDNFDDIDCSTFIPIIKKMNGIKGSLFGFCSNQIFSSWYDFILDFSEELFALAKKNKYFKDSKYIDEVREEIKLGKNIFNEISTPYFVHNDLGRKNFLYKKLKDKFVFYRVIDIEKSLYGDVDFEFSRAEITDKDCYNAILEGSNLTLTENRIVRLRIYSLLNYLISMNILKGQYNIPSYFKHLRDLYIKRFNEKNSYIW